MKLYAKIYVYENIYFIEYIISIRVLKILWFQKIKNLYSRKDNIHNYLTQKLPSWIKRKKCDELKIQI